MRRRPKWPSDLEKVARKTFPAATIRHGAALVLAADARAGILFETAFQLGNTEDEVDGWTLAGALDGRGIKASYDSCVAFLERLAAIAAGEEPATTVEMRAQAAPAAAGGARAVREPGRDRGRGPRRGAGEGPGPGRPPRQGEAAAAEGGGSGRSRRRRRRSRRPRREGAGGSGPGADAGGPPSDRE